MPAPCDLVIIGGGPTGLSAAINAASEGLNVRLLDSGQVLGGQAKESHGIENYPGFPESIEGGELMGRLVDQALKFDTKFHCPVMAQKLEFIADEKVFRILTDEYQTFVSKAVLIATGLQYRRLDAMGIDHLLGRGVSYGMPIGSIPRNTPCSIGIVGGANSAGQAVLRLAKNKNAKIKLFIRKTLGQQMSMYLIERIAQLENVEICEGCVVERVHSKKDWLDFAVIKHSDGHLEEVPMQFMFIFIGAMAKTYWLKDIIKLDDRNYIQTTPDYQTSEPGVFAAGDVRSSSVKRIAAASGEGSAAVPFIHKYISSLERV